VPLLGAGVGRLPIAGLSLATILLVRAETDSFAIAGIVEAASAIAYGARHAQVGYGVQFGSSEPQLDGPPAGALRFRCAAPPQCPRLLAQGFAGPFAEQLPASLAQGLPGGFNARFPLGPPCGAPEAAPPLRWLRGSASAAPAPLARCPRRLPPCFGFGFADSIAC
jgi:hypothetical protein